MDKDSYIYRLEDKNVKRFTRLTSPDALKKEIPVTENAAKTVIESREIIQNILEGRDKRKLLIVGPCSIHDIEEAKDYASSLKRFSDSVSDQFYIVMRTYFEKPRTTIGWKGLISDPFRDGSNNVEVGLRKARGLLLHLAEQGVPAGTEALSNITIGYFTDLLSWCAVGARTTESQTHREMGSGLSPPIGYKNGTHGELETAINALIAAREGHSFLGIDREGIVSNIETKGNSYCHLILRGGNGNKNYTLDKINEAVETLQKNSLPVRIMVDCSHANSGKDHKNQPEVFETVIKDIKDNKSPVFGLMLESNINEGSQKDTGKELRRGVSITDACMSWPTTERIITDAYNLLK